MSALSIPIAAIVIVMKDRKEVINHGLMKGFDAIVWFVILLQALGGLVVAVVIKYADNILKAFATSIAIVISCVASIFLFEHYPNYLFTLGAIFVIISTIIYGAFPYNITAAKPSAKDIKLVLKVEQKPKN